MRRLVFATKDAHRITQLLAAVLLLCFSTSARTEPIPVIQKQGATHGFLVLEDESGKEIAVGDQVAVAHGDEIRSTLTFKFRDGSIDEETTVFRQDGVFTMIRDHHVQKGPSFPKPIDVTVDVPKKQVSWIEMSKDGPKSKTETIDPPADLANGMVSLLIENFPSRLNEMHVSYLAVDSKPRMVKLIVTRDGTNKIHIGTTGRSAQRFNVHVNLEGIAGAVAPMIGKQPPDMKLWRLDGEAPTFVRMSGPLYENGPTWTILLTSPRWPKTMEETSRK